MILFASVGVGLVALLGWLIPLGAQHGATWLMEPWFQALLKMTLLVLGVVMPIASLLTWMERKQSAQMQDRVGPNRAALPLVGTLKGVPHFVADAVKMIMKEDFVPAKANRILFTLAPVMAILGAFLVYGTLEPYAIAEAQGPNPLHWGIVTQPLGFILFFTAAIAETKRTPFDTPEGESEVVGYFVEYSGMRFGTFFLAEFIEVVFLSAVMATVFFGGWQVPFLYTDGFHLGSSVFQLPHGLV